MKVSELQTVLAEIQKEHGDIEVTAYQWNDPLCPHVIQGVEVFTVRPNYFNDRGILETFVINKHLRNGGFAGGAMYTGKRMKQIMKQPLQEVAQILYND